MKAKNVIELKQGTGFNMNNGGVKPLQITYTNNTNEVKKVYAFETFHKNNEGVSLSLMSGSDNISLDYFKKFFYETPHLSSLARLQSTSLMNKQSEKVFYLVEKNPMGEVSKEPAFIPLDILNKQQFQSGILDIPYSFLLDGLSYDFEFDLMPNSIIVLTLFFSHKSNERNKKSLKELNDIRQKINKNFFDFKYIGSVVIENNYEEEKEIILLDRNKYKEYSLDYGLRIYDLFSLNNQDMCDAYSNRNDYFNSIRIYSNGGKNNLKQISSPLEFNSGNKYFPAVEVNGNQFQQCVNDVNIVGEELSSNNPIKVTVMPKTTVVYLFKQYREVNNSSTKESFYNIIVENKSDESKKVNVINIFDDIKGKDVLHKVGKNRLALTESDFSSNLMRVLFYNHEQIENPILIRNTDVNGVQYSQPIFPLCYLNERDFNSEIIDIPTPSIFFKEQSELIFDLPKKGDGANIILGSVVYGNVKSIENKHLMFPIWIENTTNESKTIELENDITNFKDLPEGVTCKVGIDSSYRELLARIEGQGCYSSLILNKIYSRNTAQITQILTVTDYTDSENPTQQPIITQSYFSAMQFYASLISLGNGFPIFDLNRTKGENEIKKDSEGNEYNCSTLTVNKKMKVAFNILPKTKVGLICTLQKNSIPLTVDEELKSTVKISKVD